MKKKKDSNHPPGDKTVEAGQWQERARPVWRPFPGPRVVDVPLRVAFTRGAFAELTGHAKESLESEICGVLAGELCEDEAGLFVEVQVAVPGTAARQGRGHVTFTQETWTAIHNDLERDHPTLKIVGWYHTHPGFGVEFSEMDAFVQKHFFPLSSQVALVMDPLGGEVAIGMNGPSGLQYLGRFWVDGREHRARFPATPSQTTSEVTSSSVASLEVRVSQLVTVVHELRASLHRTLLISGLSVGLAIVAIFGYAVYRSYHANMRPPENIAFVPLPLLIEGKPALIGVGIVKWDFPPELWALPLREPSPNGAVTASPPPSASAPPSGKHP